MSEKLSFGDRVRKALIWRSGTQILAQVISWGSTLAVIRILDPADYGLFAMTQVVLVFLSFLNGYGLASSIVQSDELDPVRLRQAFGALLLLNGSLAILQFLLAPLAAEYYRQPIVADLLRMQAVIYLATPFIVLPEALMARNLEFKKTALVNLLSAVVGAIVALSCAWSGLGVWTLVYAAIAIFWTQAIGLFLAAKMYIWPSFNFGGAGDMFKFGGTVMLAHIFWTIQSQSDVFIASRWLTPYEVGLYAEAVFLTALLASKFIPPLNEVAFPAYSRIRSDLVALKRSFLKAVRLIMLVACPIYLGMAASAEELVHVVLGEKWLAMVPLISVLALVMPLVTLQILFAPLNNALGRPEIAARVTMFGAAVMSLSFWIGVQFGLMGLAYAWVAGMPLLTAFTFYLSKGHLQLGVGEMLRAISPSLFASCVMALLVHFAGEAIQSLPVIARLVTLLAIGAASYGAILFVFARPTLIELLELIRRRKQGEIAEDEILQA